MGLEKQRRRFHVKGNITFGAGDVGIGRSAAGAVSVFGAGTAQPGTVDLASDALRIPYGTAALTAAILGTVNGNVKLGRNGNTLQFGFVNNGTPYIMSGTTGGGALTLTTAS